MTQYSKRMVIVHWLTLALLIAAWYLGDSLSELTDASHATLSAYLIHLAAGGAVLLLAVVRLLYRGKDGTPPAIGQGMMDKVAKGVHHLLYLVLFALPLSGILTVINSSVIKGLLANDANLLPKDGDFDHLFAHSVHETLVTVLIVLVAVHVLGAIKHQFIMKDGLLERMMLPRK